MISLLFTGFLLLAALWSLYYARNWNRDLTVSLDFLHNFVYAGSQAQLQEQIENRKKLPLPVLEVAFHVDKNLCFHGCENTSVSDYAYKRDIFALLGRQRVTRTLTLDCPRRGFYRISQSDLTAFSMLHRKRFSASAPADTALYVYAARTDVSDILAVCERLIGNLQCAKRLFEDPFAFSSIREYTTTDPMNTINWKASARTGALMVNTFESTLTQKAVLCLDVEDSGILKYDHLTEASISIAASLAQRLLGRGMEVGICVNACGIAASDRETPAPFTFWKPACGKGQLAAIEQLLARYRLGGKTTPLADVLGMTPDLLPEDAVAIFISKNVAHSQKAIEQFTGRERQAVWVVPHTRGESCEVQARENIRVVRREVSPA